LNQDIYCLDEFQDDPNQLWTTTAVAEVIKIHVLKVNASVIFTFDNCGVSGHLNHIATNAGAK